MREAGTLAQPENKKEAGRVCLFFFGDVSSVQFSRAVVAKDADDLWLWLGVFSMCGVSSSPELAQTGRLGLRGATEE